MKYEKRKFVILALSVILTIILYHFVLKDILTFEQLKAYRNDLVDFVRVNFWISITVFILIFILVAGLSLPGSPVLTMAGAYVFGIVPAVIFVNIGATAGAVIAFFISRFLLGDWVQSRFHSKLKHFNSQVRQNGIYYLLTVRLMPLFPFTWINLFSGLTKMKISTFIWTTSLGIIPGTLLNAFAGKQLSNIDSPNDLFSPGVLSAFFLLGLFALLPVFYHRWKRKRHRAADDQ